MIHDIRQVFLANLDKLEWMDDATKEKAREKVLCTGKKAFSFKQQSS